MTADRPEGILLIGLHKLAAQYGDGLIPELLTLLAERERMARERTNVVAFPVWSARLPGEAQEHEIVSGSDENIIAFRAQPGENPAKRSNG